MVKKVLAAAAVLSLAAMPAVAEVSKARAVAPVEDESEVGGGSGLIIALVAAAVGIAAVVAAGGGDNAPVSP
ncbi:hypothetical protein [Altererythrobacter litoralis]|uniref:Ferrochelatase n=1 Tax=Altererythrobacter litoralis TaxID=3113904 RepID=A0ABU7GFA4_9SPHN|nr:hypothetical protein [Erythrobacteraceae bacterium 1XM1-14]